MHLVAAFGRSHPWRNPPLPLPPGTTETQIRDLISSVRVDGGPPAELDGYWREAFGRFLRTWDLARDLTGSALELGANPYFLTVLLKEFSALDVTLANYFGSDSDARHVQRVTHTDLSTGASSTCGFSSWIFDAETDPFPFADESFDVVFFCEIIEHMTMDPLATLRQINRVLRNGGHLILTTPNVGRLENVARMVLGENIYDPYSGYGPHGRHNREYSRREVEELLHYAGFELEAIHTADSHPPRAYVAAVAARAGGMTSTRAQDLGQYIFVRARRVDAGRKLRPAFLYRSYPAGEIEE